ncbi:hypothetical protein E2C01_010457 [Portunus trituberculatus]|uniref:Uncharacterized protein n=1 Tax=Portunus trituberculatus TaxID=210409 RepID=A0A5B7D8I8_PORTR|nr:hypothetical protein [Portunus trituberculatus]
MRNEEHPLQIAGTFPGLVEQTVGQIDFSSIQLPRHLQRGGNSAASTSTAVTSPTLGDSTQATALPTAKFSILWFLDSSFTGK